MDGDSSQRAALHPVGRDHEQTQNHVRQATAALDSAFRRIRQLRHSILELADVMPSLESATRNRNPSDMGPAHEGILLSDSNEDPAHSLVADMDRLRSTLPPQVMESLERFEAEQAERQSGRFPGRTPQPPIGTPSRDSRHSSSSRNNVHSTNSSRDNDSRDSHWRPPPRSWLETQISRRRDSHLDDVSTTLGRRVAAREARGAQNTVDDSASQVEQILLNTTALIARNIDNVNNRIAAQRVLRLEQMISPRTDVVPEHRRLPDAEVRSNRSTDGYSGRGSQNSGIQTSQLSSAATNLPPSRQTQSRRWRPVRPEAGGRQTVGGISMSGQSETSSGTSARLSALSNFSTFDNLDSPSTPLSRERPILFDEPHSYVQPVLRSEDLPAAAVADSRSYLVRRRLNADGDELVHNINLSEWDEEDPSAWLMSSQDPSTSSQRFRGSIRLSDYILQRSDPTTSQMHTEIPRRRRGWARLDPDGNEIPTDEEEELERTRSQFRVRALQNARATTSSSLIQPGLTTLMPVTRTSILHEPGEEENVARVRINAQESTRYATSAVVDRSRRMGIVSRGHQATNSNAETVVPSSPDMFGTSLPFPVDPLPMPLDAMVTLKSPSTSADRTKGVIVPEHAIWAGR